MPGSSPVGGLGRPLADQDLRGEELLAPPAGPGSWAPQRPSGAQARAQLTAQRAAALDVQGLVDRLVRDPHRPIFREVDPQSARDLLRTPRLGPAPVLTAAVTPPDPANLRTWHRRAVGRGDQPGKPVLHDSRSASLPASLATLGRLAHRSACQAAVVARYSSTPPRVAALRRSSREIVDGDRPTRRAIWRTPQPWP
jgi:hypothetical protein